jgi:HEAT repeat protein
VEKVIAEFLQAVAQKDDERAEAEAVGFAALPEAQAGEALQELLDSINAPEVDTRWWGIRAIAALSTPLVLAFLIRALNDVHASVRQCAALGLRMHPDIQAIPSLVKALADEDGLVARLASDALVNIGESAVPALLEVASTGDRIARSEAVRALASIGDQRSIPVLFAALNEDSALIEYWANEGLDRMGVGMKLFAPE